MRFQVPQFIEIEDKIIGPLTFKQFIYIAGGAGVCAIAFILLPKFLAFIISAPVALFAAALAFYKVNSKPFVEIVEAFLAYSLAGKLYLWKKEEKQAVPKTDAERRVAPTQVYVPKLSQSKLKDLSFALDVERDPTGDNKDTL